MATSIFFNGRRINVPGAYSRIDASALASSSPSAVGIVALIGEAEGGEPLSVAESVSDMTRPGQIIDKFRSGPLKTASSFAFEPSTDEAIPGGAQRVIAVKVNPATQSLATIQDDAAADAVDLNSTDYGLFTTAISLTIADGTTAGKLITVSFEGEDEVFDDVGGTAAFTVLYAGGADGYDDASMLATLTSTQYTVAASKAETGLAAEITAVAPVAFPSAVDVVSANAADIGMLVTIYGLGAASVAQQETVTLNGTTNVQTVLTDWTKVLGIAIAGTTAGIVTVADFPVVATIATLAAGANTTAGIVQTTNTPIEGFPTVTIDVDTAIDVVLFGETAAGVATGERFDMTTGNTTPVVGTVAMRKITVMALGEALLARTTTFSGNAAQTAHATFNTISKVVSKLNTLDGFTATALVTNPTTFLMTDMDFAATAASVAPVAGSFFADLFFFIKAINENSAFMEATRATGACCVPANTTSPVFLTAGIEGVTTITQWQAAFNLLRGRRANIIVPLTQDPAVHALLASHLVERAGRLRSEANGYVGIGTAAGAGQTLAVLKSEIQVLQTRHISPLVQEVERFDPDTGVATFYPPYQFAAISAGMQAGSPIGEPLTHKRPSVTDIRNDSSWSVENDIESLIDAGAMVAEKVDNVGIRFVRSITSHLADNNVVFTEMSANESANTAVFRLRTTLELKIGKRGLIGSIAAIKGLANDALGRLIDDEIIFAYRSLRVEQVGDVFPVSVEIAPVLPINFIPVTVHLVAARAAA